jgi:hypothetical protein
MLEFPRKAWSPRIQSIQRLADKMPLPAAIHNSTRLSDAVRQFLRHTTEQSEAVPLLFKPAMHIGRSQKTRGVCPFRDLDCIRERRLKSETRETMPPTTSRVGGDAHSVDSKRRGKWHPATWIADLGASSQVRDLGRRRHPRPPGLAR